MMAAREVAVKRYVVRLSADERERLETLIGTGKSPCPTPDEGADTIES
jgi:hypothetical protein